MRHHSKDGGSSALEDEELGQLGRSVRNVIFRHRDSRLLTSAQTKERFIDCDVIRKQWNAYE